MTDYSPELVDNYMYVIVLHGYGVAQWKSWDNKYWGQNCIANKIVMPTTSTYCVIKAQSLIICMFNLKPEGTLLMSPIKVN